MSTYQRLQVLIDCIEQAQGIAKEIPEMSGVHFSLHHALRKTKIRIEKEQPHNQKVLDALDALVHAIRSESDGGLSSD